MSLKQQQTSMKNLKFAMHNCLKSRFTGFFAFLLLTACQPSPDNQSELMQRARYEPEVALQLATQRLANGEYEAALQWFRQGALLGSDTALQHALQLQQRQYGKLATAQWLQLQLDSGAIGAATIKPEQRAELGLWQGGEPLIAGFSHPDSCALTLQPVVTQQTGVKNWQQLLQQWQHDPQLQQLPVCFLPLQRVNSLALSCSEHSDKLITCHYPALDSLVQSGQFSQLVIVAGRGKASYNNGILQLPENGDFALLRHEFMHILGFIDEYALADTVAKDVCQQGRIHPNLVLAGDVKHYVSHWALDSTPALTKVDTCDAAGVQAYRVAQAVNAMQFYELALPGQYLQLAQFILQQPEKLMPVQYYYAYLARQRQKWQKWQEFMQQASMQGYAEATQALAP